MIAAFLLHTRLLNLYSHKSMLDMQYLKWPKQCCQYRSGPVLPKSLYLVV